MEDKFSCFVCVQDWASLEKEIDEYQQAMQDELDRFVSLLD